MLALPIQLRVNSHRAVQTCRHSLKTIKATGWKHRQRSIAVHLRLHQQVPVEQGAMVMVEQGAMVMVEQRTMVMVEQGAMVMVMIVMAIR